MSWSVEHVGAVAVVTFRRPPENLLSFRLLDELDDVLVDLSDDRTVSVVLMTGGVPGYFVGHADLEDVGRLVGSDAGAGDDQPERAERDLDAPGSPNAWARTLERLSQISQPVVAAVLGQAWGGGCELVLAAQLRVAAQGAHFSFVEVAAGAIPGAVGTQRLPRLVGAARAFRMITSGDVVPAVDALSMGLVDAVLPDAQFLELALEWVDSIARQPRHALAAAKRAIIGGLRMPLAAGIAHEQTLFRAVLRSPETPSDLRRAWLSASSAQGSAGIPSSAARTAAAAASSTGWSKSIVR